MFQNAQKSVPFNEPVSPLTWGNYDGTDFVSDIGHPLTRPLFLTNTQVQGTIGDEEVWNAKIEYGILFILVKGLDSMVWEDVGYVESETEAGNLIRLHTLAGGFLKGRRI